MPWRDLPELLQKMQRAAPWDTRNPGESRGGPSPGRPSRGMGGRKGSLLSAGALTPNSEPANAGSKASEGRPRYLSVS